MKRTGVLIGAGCSLILFALTFAWAGQEPEEPQPTPPAEAAQQAPDHSSAYYHYMLARRYRELAGIRNRGDYIERSIAEYKKAMEADPDSLFLRVELAELYWRMGQIADAVRDAEEVLKINPDQADAHRLLANIYWRNLGESQPRTVARQSLQKAIEHFEALARLDPKSLENYLVLGRLYRLNNQRDKAEEAYRQVLNSSPDSKHALASLSELYFDQGDYDQTIELLKRVPEDDLDARLLGMLAYAYSQEQDYDNAIATYEKALADQSDNQEIRRYYADALAGAGRYAAARTELAQVLKAEPDDGPTYLRLARLDRQVGKFDEARAELEKAKDLMPDSVEVTFELAMLEDTLGNQDEAVGILKGLVAQAERPNGQYTAAEKSNRAIFLERLGLIYRTQEDFDKALETFEQVKALGGEYAARGEALIIESLRLDRQPQKALQTANAAAEEFPQDRALGILRATLLGELGRVDEAMQHLQSMLNDSAGDRGIYLTIAQVYSQAKRFAEAEASARQALELSKHGEQEYAHFVLGSIYERQKKFNLAEEQFRQVLAMNPLNAAAFNYLGYMLADRGVRLEESVDLIRKALEIEPSNAAYLDSLGWAYYKMDRLDLAVPHLEKAAQMSAGEPTIQEHLGHLYLRMGRRREAQAAWERALKEWPTAISSDFDAEQAARLQKQLDKLKVRPAQ